MIMSFRGKVSAALMISVVPKGFPPDVAKRAAQKLAILDAATDLNDLRIPPGNRLEALAGERKGQHSIRVNDQWRICFIWSDGNAYDVEVTDYY